MKKIIALTGLGLAGLVSMPAYAGSTTSSGPATGTGLSAATSLDFTITIPQVVYLRVGTTTAATADPIAFSVAAANLGDGSVTGATNTSGDLSNGAVTVRVYGNSGNISLKSTTTGPMTNTIGTGNETIPWSQISVNTAALATTTAGFTNAPITHPGFNSGATGGDSATATTLVAVNRLVRAEGQWTYRYANASFLPAGIYGVTSAKNGRVTYTASLP